MNPRSSLALFFVLLIFSDAEPATAACHPDDESGLLAFKSGITADPLGILSSWKLGSDCCTWNAITCGADKRVQSIYLVGQSDNPADYLSGTVSNSLSKLRSMTGFYLLDLKNLTGPFPSFIFGLPNIEFVYIENNKFSGPIPATIGKLIKLYVLSLEGNRFTGRIPTSISGSTGLTQLKLGGNLLTGTIPVSIQNLKKLNVLSLARNRLTGTIPDFLGSLLELRILRLSHNNFTGSFPAGISTLAPNLQYLELGHNALTGRIPDFLGKFTSLDTLDLSSNRFSGTVPASFRNLTKIFNLDLSRNRLQDPFPAMNVKGIESLDLSYNMFHLGKIPSWVTSSPIIYSLKLAKCGIKMTLDDWKPEETYFYDYIDLSDNEISGTPIGLLNRTELLVGFSASGNNLRFDMGKLKFPTSLKQLELSQNLVFGKVPDAVSALESLNVSYNRLCGKIPATRFPASSFIGNACLCGSPLAPCKA